MITLAVGTDDPLDSAALPPTDKTELNYRTRPLGASEEARLSMILLLAPIPILICISVFVLWLTSIHLIVEIMFLGILLAVATRLGWLQLVGALHRVPAIVACVLSSAYCYARIWQWLDPRILGPVALFVTWVTSVLICKQVANWILVGPTVDYETMQRWEFNLPGFIPKLSLECPELLNASIGILLVGPVWWASAFVAAEMLGEPRCWPLCFVIFLHLAWYSLHTLTLPLVQFPSFSDSWKWTWRAFVIFTTYDLLQTKAAGVFRFPSRWLRPIVTRWVLVLCTLSLLSCFIANACLSPFESFQQGETFLSTALMNLLLIGLAAPALLLSLLWFTSGAVLARFDKELSKPSAGGATIWDNYVDRIVNSSDELEREHVFIGTTIDHDFPVLVHRDIYDQHGHILGDSGASKTSLGIAPQVTQLIARADSTVVVVDLKGDKALFEACRLEAKRAGRMKFRWICNEVGKNSFAFNPFLQTHNQHLSVEQLSQQILQGLSLDYGLEYGAGYYTAMNEIVLTTALQNAEIRSFRDLNHRLSDRRWYSRHGHSEDWNVARHLGALVSRLACNEAINVVPNMFEGRPQIHTESVDCLDLYDEPQVIYLWLRSSVEPTNAPAMARLFLWAMFNAASQRQGNQRVYFFMDEIQQVIGNGIKLIFEQFRDMGGTIIASHQTAGQLRRHGTDLGDTIDSCTAVKQVFRASDLHSIERIESLAGKSLKKVAHWMQPFEPGTGNLVQRLHPVYARDGLVNVRQVEQPNLDRRRVMEISSKRLASFVRFTFGSGYTQFGGATIPILSPYAITFDEYEARRRLPWPTAEGAFEISPSSRISRKRRKTAAANKPVIDPTFLSGFDKRGPATL